MSLKLNIFAGYVSQVYVTLVGIAILPLYIKYMGAETYGLVGFFTMLQAWFTLLDLGLTPTISRETARFKAGAISPLAYRQLFRALSSIFFVIALVGGGVLAMLSAYIADGWLKVQALSQFEVRTALQIMAVSVAMRWLGGLYRGVITGAEHIVWLSGYSVFLATLRFIIVLPVMSYFGYTPLVFFTYQLIVALLDTFGMWLKTLTLLPRVDKGVDAIGWSLQPVKPILKFSIAIAFTSSVWILVTQTDKLILSSILSLSDYGHFTMAVLIASGIMVISGPISGAIMPRMAKLHTEKKFEELVLVYRNATQLVSILAGTAAITLAFCAEPLLAAWTGDAALARQIAPILKLYAIGNSLLAVGAFPYYLQYAMGNLRYHLIGAAGMVTVLIPSVIIAANMYGGLGAGFVWLAINLLFLFGWVPYVHYKLMPEMQGSWLWGDVVKVVAPGVFAASLLSQIGFDTSEAFYGLIYSMVLGGVVLCAIMMFSYYVFPLTLLKKIRG
ncbi:oligosaccharide flippase family protein [Pseudomonas palleroniana]